MNPSQTIIYSDLDGTLFNGRNEIGWTDLAAISEYIDAGGRFAVATGRAPQNALGFFWGLRQNAPAIVMNGAGAYDFSAGEYLFCEQMDRGRLDPFLTELLASFPDLELQVYTDKDICYCLPEERCQPTLLRLHRPCVFGSFGDTLGRPLIKCLLYCPPELDEALGAALAEAAPGCYHLVPGTVNVEGERIHYYEIMPENVTKALALERLRSHPLLSGRTVIAAGDNWNDMEFLRAADVAVTPANAIPELKALSRFTTVDNEHNVVAHIITDVLPKL